ncbi:phosphatase PAP2 family protein [Brevibacillus choshinensis]|uniref:Phosphatase PAP2 family protein n=1 Tax=Brevibacillus choshinensis TaxID=54911 RepID=A0ABX7FXN4_BRECH|nr:phosphatase PAP2 family protein [Brevibacillus choshinensis]QRG70551.1 phosphatase PAP2 family protein [Brevibacillus choshinensis]
MKRNGRGVAIGAVLFAAMSVALISLYMTGKVNGMDETGFALAADIRTEAWTSFFTALTYLGSGVVLAPVGVVLIVALFAKKLRAEALTLLLTLGGGELLNELLKAVFARPRPTDVHLIPLPDSFSFPSGHAMIAPAFYCMLAYLVSRWLRGSAWATIVQVVTVILVVLLGASRVYLGVHYASDVLTGFCLAMCGYFLVRYGYERHLERQPAPASPIVPSP